MQFGLKWVALMLAFSVFGFANAASLSDFNGNKRSISDFTGHGKWLIVMIWAHDCHVCNQEVGSYVKFHREHKDKDASLLGISLDGQVNKKLAEAFISRHKVNFPNLISEPGDVISMYRQLTGENRFGTPAYLIYLPEGDLVAQQVGAVPPNLIEAFLKQAAASKTPKQ